MIYGFVILNYLAYQMTIKCTDYIISLSNNDNCYIAIVDNDSNNNSYNILNEHFKEYNNISVLKSSNNLGFARGNNIGYKYLRLKYNPDYIIILNNDVIIKQEDFLTKLDKIYNKNKYDIIGPDIYAINNNTHQNPARFSAITLEELDERIKFFRKYLNNGLKGDAFRFYINSKVVLQSTIKRGLRKNENFRLKDVLNHSDGYYTLKKENEIRKKDAQNVVLHGACYIFTKNFINNEILAFNPNTFLYMEEDILYQYCMKKNYSIAYCPMLKVIHLEDISTNLKYNNLINKYYAKIKYSLDSALILRDIITNSN